MHVSELKEFFFWSAAINYGVLLVWFAVFVFAHEWVYRMHTRWFRLSVETFDALNYLGVAVYKIGIMLLNLTPLIALHLIR
ncbi:MAG: putative rane protein [Paucimonas sp.]|nr:putative rane protein [Paucimonas sp.]